MDHKVLKDFGVDKEPKVRLALLLGVHKVLRVHRVHRELKVLKGLWDF